MRNRMAFTLVETTVVIALIAALTAITIPRASGFIDSIEVRGAVTEIESMFSLARHSAIARGSQVTLAIDAAARTLSVAAGAQVIRTREVGLAHAISRIVVSDARAISVTDRYLIGPDALSRIQPSGYVIDSPVPGGGGSVISAAELGTVTSRSTLFRWKKQIFGPVAGRWPRSGA